MVGYFFLIVGFYKFRFCKCFIPVIMRAINKQDMCLLISKVVIFKKKMFLIICNFPSHRIKFLLSHNSNDEYRGYASISIL